MFGRVQLVQSDLCRSLVRALIRSAEGPAGSMQPMGPYMPPMHACVHPAALGYQSCMHAVCMGQPLQGPANQDLISVQLPAVHRGAKKRLRPSHRRSGVARIHTRDKHAHAHTRTHTHLRLRILAGAEAENALPKCSCVSLDMAITVTPSLCLFHMLDIRRISSRICRL
jgi:hypothetical protein